MANKALATRQKMRLKSAPAQQFSKPRNPVAVAATLRSAGSHAKGAAQLRQAAKRALKKIKLDADED